MNLNKTIQPWIGALTLIGSVVMPAFSQNSVLDRYIAEGLQNNLGIRMQQTVIQKDEKAVQEAKSLFYPNVNFGMQYTLAYGGRKTELPIGDLINPVYQNLNAINAQLSPGTPKYPTLSNTEIQFLPNNFHDTRFRTTYPVFNNDLRYNREIKKELVNGDQYGLEQARKELIKNIKLAYYQFLQADEAVRIYQNALDLVRENLRVNEKLLANDKVTRAAVLKAESEVSKLESEVFSAENKKQDAAAYLNYLLQKPLDSPLEADTTLIDAVEFQVSPVANAQQREELSRLQSGIKATELALQLNRSYRLPKIGLAWDLGFQGFGFNIFDKQFYTLLGLQIELPVYTAKKNQLKAEQTQLDLELLKNQFESARQQVGLQVDMAQRAVETARNKLKPCKLSLNSSQEYYRLTEKRYREGQAMLIELVDARNQLTTATLQYNIARYELLMRIAEWERVR